MRNFTALLLMFHLVSISNAGHDSEISQGHYHHKSDNLPPGSDVILDNNCVRVRGKTSLIDIPNQTRNLETRNLETETFEVMANATYLKVQPCLTSAWIMDSWETKNFTFPLDAEEHFRSLKEKTEIFRNTKIHQYANYGGPWIENIFIENYMKKPLSFFGGFIPLFIQWIDTDIVSKREFVAINVFLKTVLRPDVIYLAISQGDIGLGHIGIQHPNIMVLTCGGFGHVPLPLIRGEIDTLPLPTKYKYDIAFFGSMRNGGRGPILEKISHAVRNTNMTFIAGPTPHWMSEMEHTKINLAPRGYGRNSFRLAEIIQMGRIPFVLYDDILWQPYEGTEFDVSTYAYVASTMNNKSSTCEDIVDRIANATDAEYLQKLAGVKKVRRAFTYQGVFEEIEAFLRDPFGPQGGHLRCATHPRTMLCCG